MPECLVAKIKRFTYATTANWFLIVVIHVKTRHLAKDTVQFLERWMVRDILWNQAQTLKYFPTPVAHLFSGERRAGDEH